MNVEFLIDDNNNVWLSSASDIHTRKAVSKFDKMNLINIVDPEKL